MEAQGKVTKSFSGGMWRVKGSNHEQPGQNSSKSSLSLFVGNTSLIGEVGLIYFYLAQKRAYKNRNFLQRVYLNRTTKKEGMEYKQVMPFHFRGKWACTNMPFKENKFIFLFFLVKKKRSDPPNDARIGCMVSHNTLVTVYPKIS